MKEKLEGALGCAFDSVNDVHVDVVSKALNVNCRSTGKFMNVSCELFLTKRVFVPQHDDRSEHQDHEERISVVSLARLGFFFLAAFALQTLQHRCAWEHVAADTGLEGGFLVWE